MNRVHYDDHHSPTLIQRSALEQVFAIHFPEQAICLALPLLPIAVPLNGEGYNNTLGD